jgi:hypothetical protein
MRNSKRRSPMLRKRDRMKKFSPKRELRSSRNSKRRKLPRSSKPRKWSKNSYLLKLSKRLKLLPQRKQLLKPTLPD